MKTKNTNPAPPVSVQNFPIVGVGASAGGLDAFKRFLKAIPEDSGMAYVIVQHLDPDHESILPEILEKVTSIPVNKITNEIHLAPNHIYVIPQNKTLTSTDGILKITPREKLRPHLPIDIFFSSLAEVHLNLAIGIVLSGTGKDGTLGLESIKKHGGITFAQDEESSSYDGMPQSAINAKVVDFILPPEKIPEKLMQIIEARDNSEVIEDLHSKASEITYQKIIFILRQRSGVDFSNYKQTTIRRRIARRLAISKKEKLEDYLRFLRSDKDEQDKLYNDMLIPVTAFFRDPEIFQAIKEKVFPEILMNKLLSDPIRIWVAGCSTGAEAYSLAITLHESSGKKLSGKLIQIFASDISEPAIAKARTGTYFKSEVKNVSDSILKKYFVNVSEGYQVNRQIRDMCVFAHHDFLKDPPFAKISFISCRNVLIYMDTFLQKKALTTFHYALKDKGFLFLGKSETTGVVPELFAPFSKGDKVYSRKSNSSSFLQLAKLKKDQSIEFTASSRKSDKIQKPQIDQNDLRKMAEANLLLEDTPPSVVINDHMDIVHIHGIVTPFLEPSPGKPTFNLIKMAKESLAFELRNVLHKVKITNTTVIKKGIPIRINNRSYMVSIKIKPLADSIEPHYLVIFRKTAVSHKTKTNSDLTLKSSKASEARRIAVEKELAQTREDMRAITEEQEAANEELQSANEELLSSSEELQSLNEELESSKEETQSSNEELLVANQELLDKQEQINAGLLYAESVISTILEPLVVLDKVLSIKSVNPAFIKKFNITEQEAVGKFIYEIKNNLFENSLMHSMLDHIISKKAELNDFELTLNLPPLGECVLLLNARLIFAEKIKEQLILLAFSDITERKISENRKKEFAEELEVKVKTRTQQLEQTNILLDQYTYTASHEFQEPLRKIITISNLLKDIDNKSDPEEVKEYLNKTEGASVRMRKLIHDMLNFASVKNIVTLLVETDLNEIFKNILFDFELLIEEKNAQIIVGKLPNIEAVPFQMNQLFYDLISNALKFSKKSTPPVIEISSHKLTKEEMKLYPVLNPNLVYYEIIINDNGIGFDQKYSGQIFIMFQRLVTNVTYAGTGIGLAMCKKIVQTYHGEIFAKSIENIGATFHVILPTQQPKNSL